jgi:hypothetical protein
MSRLAPGIIVFEKRPCREPELKRQFAGRNLNVRPCRSAADVRLLMDRMPGSVLVLDLAAGPDECLRLVGHAAQVRQAVVVGPPEFAELEWPLRELGAAAYVLPTIPGRRLAELCARLLGAMA